jgi:DNA-binding LytR/AlgR family response regulator
MASMEQRLSGANNVRPQFVRIRRSALVNVQAIVTFESYGKGMFVLHLRNGSKLVSSRYHQTGLRKVLRSER